MNTPTEREVEKLAERIQDKMSFDWEACCEIAHWHLSQVAAKDERIRELEKALDGLSLVCTCSRPAILSDMGGMIAPGPHTNKCVMTRAQSALKTKEAGK